MNRGRRNSLPFSSSEIYNGENYDARLEPSGWDQPSFSDSKLGSGRFGAPNLRPRWSLRIFSPSGSTKSLKPRTVTNPTPGVYIFDLGQNMVGWARLHVSGKAGTKVRMRFGEVLKPNGELYTENLRTAEATDTYILRGKGSETFEPHFTFHGFRYVELTGYPGTPTKPMRSKASCSTRPRPSPFSSALETRW